ncbi:hypothetical protein D5086_020978 [Populus alba]|uniref:Uncharacterized protein n=1 Tax=Populus alba TaxID=43335 RepID=A0ACC4BN30_POPAL
MAPKKEKAPPPSSKPAKSGGGKQKKKKWSKGKQKEKVNNMVLFDQATYDKLLSEAPKYKLITPSVLSDRLRISGSLARKAIKDLMARGSIRMNLISCLNSRTLAILLLMWNMDTSSPSFFVNGESLPLYNGKRVRAVVQVIQSDGADTTAKSTDEHQLIIKGLPVIPPLKFVEVIGIADGNQSVHAETWTNFGDAFGTTFKSLASLSWSLCC